MSINKQLKIGDLTAKLPIIQGGMGVGVSRSSLAGAVAKEGGVGIISTAQIGYDEEGFEKDQAACNNRAIHKHIKRAKEIAQGNGLVGVNIMVATRGYEEYVRAAVEAGIDLIISGAGLPVTLPGLVEGSGVKIAPIVSSLKSVQVIMKYWERKSNRFPDLIVIEGPKAGGHLGFTREYLEQENRPDYNLEIMKIIQFVRSQEEKAKRPIPVVVAGGIMSSKDLEQVRSLGANGVQIASRFVTTYECDAHENFKRAYLNASEEDIIIVNSPVGMPGRAIRTGLIEKAARENLPHGKCHGCIITCRPQETPYCITEALINAVKGNLEEGLVFCGANTYQLNHMEHVSDIMKEFKL